MLKKIKDADFIHYLNNKAGKRKPISIENMELVTNLQRYQKNGKEGIYKNWYDTPKGLKKDVLCS